MYHLKLHLADHKVSRSNAHKKTTTEAKEKREPSSASERKYFWCGKTMILLTLHTLKHLQVFYYLRGNRFTDDPHYIPGTEVRHTLCQIKCIS